MQARQTQKAVPEKGNGVGRDSTRGAGAPAIADQWVGNIPEGGDPEIQQRAPTLTAVDTRLASEGGTAAEPGRKDD